MSDKDRTLEKNETALGVNGAYLDSLYENYLKDSACVETSLKDYFDSFNLSPKSYEKTSLKSSDSLRADHESNGDKSEGHKPNERKTQAMMRLIEAHREKGHLLAKLDPLGLINPPYMACLDPKTYGFQDSDHDQSISMQGALGYDTTTVKEVIKQLSYYYGGSVGVEFMHVLEDDERLWLQHETENRHVSLTPNEQKTLLEDLCGADLFEKFLSVKFPGAKRFGLEGGESFIPCLKEILKVSTSLGLQTMIMGMAHRGRLNVLANIVGKPLRAIFSEFQGKFHDTIYSGDVKYHLGASHTYTLDNKEIRVSLTANPSHLEAVNPVVVGKVCARQNLDQDLQHDHSMGLLIHGDAAFIGQGIVSETLLLSRLKGYTTGGTLHIIINNQIGFTTSPAFSRSSVYCSDLAKSIQAPVIHVNGDDPEAVIWAARMATHYRYRFKKDIVIDLVCYRRHGHNEMDEPSFTQPLMYQAIQQQKTVAEKYSAYLEKENILKVNDIKEIQEKLQNILQQEFAAASDYTPQNADWLEGSWSAFSSDISLLDQDTGIDKTLCDDLHRALTVMPSGFTIHPKIQRLLTQKSQMFQEDNPLDWATAEACAFGSLLKEGYGVRLSGQDSGRGTFSQRHAIIVDQETGETYTPLSQLLSDKDQHKLHIINSPLAEASVLGFEVGYSLVDPRTLVLWEAQFGDFANGAQTIIDQFICSQETKWLRLSGLVMLLPHGYEGQGPEHSSARLERYLQLCAENNMIVANCTTPANYFHILRRQMISKVRKPLIIMTPKSLLRDKHALSPLQDMTTGTRFQKIIVNQHDVSSVTRVILCSGKIAYDLEDAKAANRHDILIIRLEQLYPFPENDIREILQPLGHAVFVWCQEEPKNMGAWSFVVHELEKILEDITKNCRLLYAGRKASAATATGFHKRHDDEQKELVDKALGEPPSLSQNNKGA